MPELVEQMYCSQQIVVPPKFPYILKRYCKAAIKTQPYDLLRWSYEYFKALAEHRAPPVKLRLEYPIYSTEGGLTRGCLKVIAKQLEGMKEIPLPVLKEAWQGFCLDQHELRRVLCYCEVFMRGEAVPFLHFIAVAGGMLTKCLTHTMILLCESLTKEPDGGSAAIPVKDFLTMYKLLARIDASHDVKYINGYREGYSPKSESFEEQEEGTHTVASTPDDYYSDDFWEDNQELLKIMVIDDNIARSARLSKRLTLPLIGDIKRSASIERETQIERDNYMRERKGRAVPSEEVERKLRELSAGRIGSQVITSEDASKPKVEEVQEKKKEGIEIFVYDEDENVIPYEFYGEPPEEVEPEEVGEEVQPDDTEVISAFQSWVEEAKEEQEATETEAEKIALFVAECYEDREERREDLERTFEEIASIVERFKSADYDLGMVAGRQMSTTSGEFVVQHIEKEIMDYINQQIAILPDPDLKKKKAKPEEVAMVREILEEFLDENMAIIVPEIEEVEEEEQPIPEVIQVYAIPGIGPPVDEDTIKEFIDYAVEVSLVQADVFMPRNIRHYLCPPLEKYEEHRYDEIDTSPKEEKLAVGGVITE